MKAGKYLMNWFIWALLRVKTKKCQEREAELDLSIIEIQHIIVPKGLGMLNFSLKVSRTKNRGLVVASVNQSAKYLPLDQKLCRTTDRNVVKIPYFLQHHISKYPLFSTYPGTSTS